MAKHRTHNIEFKRQVAQDFIAGDTRLRSIDRLRRPRWRNRRP